MSAPAHCSLAPRKVCSYQPAWERRWDEYVYRHNRGSIFHLITWKRVIERAFGFQSRYLAMVDRGSIRGVLPLFLVKNVIQGKSLISTPFAVYGGICADDEETSAALRLAACRMAEEEGADYLELRERCTAAYPSFQQKQLYVTFDQRLPGNPEQLLRGFPRDTRYMIRKAQKHGLLSVVDNQQLDIFYNIYAFSVRQLGTPVFAKSFFKVLLEEFGNQCEITTVRRGEHSVAAVLSLHFRNWIVPYYAGSLAEGRRLAANNFMYWEVMRRAIEAGIEYYDFGRSKMGTGAHAFKSQWNMPEKHLPYQFYLLRRNEMPNFSPANPRFRLGIWFWKHMPLSLTKMVGPSIVRLFP